MQRTDRHGFSQVPVDQTIEQTLNRNTKTKGGIIGFSLKQGAVQRWLLTAHSRAAFVDKCRDMAGTRNDGSTAHKESSKTRMKRDEEDVKKVVEAINVFKDPFETSEELVSLSSGCVADEIITKDLMEAKERGKTALRSFVRDRLAAGSTGFYDTLPKLKLKTFTNTAKSKAVKTSNREVILKADRNLFARLLVIGQTPDENRKVDIRDLLAHELGPLPWSLAALDGSLAKTNKAVLSKLLEENVPVLPALPLSTCAIIDAMAVIQAMTSVPDKFGTLAERVFDRIVSLAGSDATRIDFVGDQYPVISIKNAERSRRSQDGQIVVEIRSSQQRCPRQWKKFLSSGKNKTCLLQFLACEWARDSYIHKLGGRVVYVTNGSLCTRLMTSDGRVLSTAVPELYTEQEEADTRMLLHALHASDNGYRQLSIYSSDADVEVLACHHQRNIPARIVIVSGTQNNSRFVDISSVCNKLGEDVCEVLPGLHALTGCDSVSAFSGKGKTKAFRLVKENKQLRKLILPLGHNVPVRDEDAADVEEFVCCMYGKADKDVNEVRYHLFCKMKNVQSHHLPPTKAALEKHIQRANLQAYIWRNALEANPAVHSPVGNGWLLKGQELIIDWTNRPPAPEAVMELVCCGCKGQCRSQRCSCVRGGMPCSDACLCEDSSCTNRPSMEDIDGDDSDPEEF